MSNSAATWNHRPSAVPSATAYCTPSTSTTAVKVPTSLRPVEGWALVLTSSGSTITYPGSTSRGSSAAAGGIGSHPGKPVAAHAAWASSHSTSAWAPSDSSHGGASSSSKSPAAVSGSDEPSKARRAAGASSRSARARSRAAATRRSPSSCTTSRIVRRPSRSSSPAYRQTSARLAPAERSRIGSQTASRRFPVRASWCGGSQAIADGIAIVPSHL